MNECEHGLKQNLSQDKDCKIINISRSYQSFEINGVEFDTEERIFRLNKKRDDDISFHFVNGVQALRKKIKITKNWPSILLVLVICYLKR
jgi:hypothetical protein